MRLPRNHFAARRILAGLAFLALLPGLSANQAEAAASAAAASATVLPQPFDGYWKEIRESFEVLAKNVVYGVVIEPADSSQNPHNRFLNLPRYLAVAEARPDFSFSFGRIEVLVKPRLRLTWKRWTEGEQEGQQDYDSDLFVNEWLLRLRVNENAFLSYGRENLQWGPSFLLSPSNPFFADNGQSNPKIEVPGMDFARFIWLPASHWTLSLIANLDQGRQEFINQSFARTYALKVDYLSFRKYFSLIASYRENDRFRLGGFFNASFSDALMVYGEWNIAPGTNALYPVRRASTPYGPIVTMETTKDDDRALQTLALAGLSYTLKLGPTLTAEYVYNSAGYSDRQAELYYHLRDVAASYLGFPLDMVNQLARYGLLQTFRPRLRLLRRNYLMVQYRDSLIWTVVNVVFRWTCNLDDSSSQFVTIVEYDVSDHAQLFVIGNQGFGPHESEFRSLVDYSWMVGLEYTF